MPVLEGEVMNRKFQVGDRVVFRIWAHPHLETGLWTGSVTATANGGRKLGISFESVHRTSGKSCWHYIWRRTWRVRLIDSSPKVSEPNRHAIVDARVLEELTAIQRNLGSTEALLDMLRDIRRSYELDSGVSSREGG